MSRLVGVPAALASAALVGCAEPVPPGKELVVVKGERFHVDVALDDASRVKGLGGVESIPARGGLLFVFPSAQPRQFLMRDCVVPIDIAFLSDTGRVLAMHAMPVEAPRGPDESALAYEIRLTKYSSRYPSRFALEVAGGTWESIGLEEGDQVEASFDRLKAAAR
jgi:uncharacterized membrane protein (UPF0127 family)